MPPWLRLTWHHGSSTGNRCQKKEKSLKHGGPRRATEKDSALNHPGFSRPTPAGRRGPCRNPAGRPRGLIGYALSLSVALLTHYSSFFGFGVIGTVLLGHLAAKRFVLIEVRQLAAAHVEKTYELGASRHYYQRRFRVSGAGADWQHEGSTLRFADASAPPTLIVYADGDWPSLHRQAELLDAALRDAGATSRTLVVPDEDHYTIILALSRDDKQVVPAMLEFIRGTDC